MMNMFDFKVANPSFENWVMSASMDDIECAIKYLEEEIEQREDNEREEFTEELKTLIVKIMAKGYDVYLNGFDVYFEDGEINIKVI